MVQKNFFFFILLTFLFVVINFCSAGVLISPQVYFTQIELQKENFEVGERVEGTVSLWNYEQFWVSDLVFHFQLICGQSEETQYLVDVQIDNNQFSLSPGEKTTKNFSYTLPKTLPNENCKLRVQLANTKGEPMSWIDKSITVRGENKFLLLENHKIVKDGQVFSPGVGVYYQPGEVPQVYFEVMNPSSIPISAFAKIITYKRNIGLFIQETEKETITFQPGERKTFTFSLPQLTKPETYLSEVRFYSVEDKSPISNSIYFRWIISGTEDGEILFIQSDKDTFQPGEEANVKIQYTGPADFEKEGGEGKIKVSLIDQEGKLVGEKEEKVELTAGEIVIKVPVKEKVDNPKILAQIMRGENILDQYEIQVKQGVQKTKETPKEEASFWQKNKKTIFLLSIPLLLVIIFIMMMKGKKEKLLKILILAALFGGTLLDSSSKALALTVVASGPSDCSTEVTLNRPIPNQFVKPGENIMVDGSFRIPGCGNTLTNNKVQIFLTKDEQIPTMATNCCENCCGASGAGPCTANHCGEVGVLNLTNHQYQHVKTIFPGDVPGPNISVGFNHTYTIPQTLPLSGWVRVYVQWSGIHGGAHWHWVVLYQPIYIYSKPSATGLRVTPPNYCSVYYPTAILSWTFSDPDSAHISERQTAYQIQVSTTPDFSSVVFDTGKIPSDSNSYAIPPTFSYCIETDCYNFLGLSWNTTYYWRVKVWDAEGLESDWSVGPSFTTPPHAYPLPNFTYSPSRPSANEVVQFTDNSLAYGGATIDSWYWTFQDGEPASSSQKNPQVKFPSPGSKVVSLRVTDSDGFTCTTTQTINIRLPLPKWREFFFLPKIREIGKGTLFPFLARLFRF